MSDQNITSALALCLFLMQCVNIMTCWHLYLFLVQHLSTLYVIMRLKTTTKIFQMKLYTTEVSLPWGYFYFEGKITQFPARFCLSCVQSWGGVPLNRKFTQQPPLLESNSVNWMLCQLRGTTYISHTKRKCWE